ncbi:MAG: amino acid adenylation domain-containing protein [Bacteroidota bacterium]
MSKTLSTVNLKNPAKAVEFWKNQLSDFVFTEIPKIDELKKDTALPRHKSLELPNELLQQILDLKEREKTENINTLLLTAHCKVLSVLSGNVDITTGYMSSNGTNEALDRLLPFRVNFVSGSWHNLIKKTRNVEESISSFADYSLSQIQKDLNSGDNLFESAFYFAKGNIAMDLNSVLTENDLGLLTLWLLSEDDGKLSLDIVYDSYKYSSQQIERIVGYYHSALKLMSTDETKFHESQSILSPEEKQILLEEFNDTKVEYPSDKTFVELFEGQVEKNPSAIAVQFEKIEWSYKDLNEKANQIANHLIEKRIKLEQAVVVIMERDHNWMATVLGILKAGGTYVPVRPDWPEVRKKTIVNKTDAQFIISDYENHLECSKIFDQTENKVSYENVEVILEKPKLKTNPKTRSTPDHLSYIIFTSGSTGEPKGAMIEHKGMLNHLYSKVNDLNLLPTDIIAQNSSQSFDISVWQLISGLLVGAKTVIYSDELILDITDFLKTVKKDNITILELVPSYMEVMLHPGNRSNISFESIKYLLVTGEPLKIGLVTSWFNYFKVPLVNAYGPTEASDDITHHFMYEVPKNNIVPVGTTIQNLNIYVVDSFGQLAPIGTKGNVLVSGIGVGRGYIGDSEKTKAVFGVDYLKPEKQLKLYNTGDIGSWTKEGVLYLFGRKDNQIKLNGYRIDLGEIEQCLSRQSGVTGNAVILKNEALHAFLVFDEEFKDQKRLLADCKTGLFQDLPHYMVPQKFHIINSLPVTPNGKVDRKALLEIDEDTIKTKQHSPPTNETERLLADIWEEELEINEIDIHSDFFELGGHSTMALKITAIIEEKTGKRLPMTSFLEERTIAEISKLISDESHVLKWDCLVPLQPQGSKTPLYIVHGGNHNVLIFKDLAKYLDKEQPVYGIQAKGLDGKVAPDDTMEEIAAHYVQEIVSSNPTGPYALAGFCFGGLIAYEMARMLRTQGKEVTLVAVFDCTIEPHIHKSNLALKKFLAFGYRIMHFLYVGYNAVSSLENFKVRMNLEKRRFRREKNPQAAIKRTPLVDRAYKLAELRYKISPQNIVIDLFKATNSVQFVHEPNYLGWKKVGVKGIRKHLIHGNQSSMFQTPYVKEFASKLQHALDNHDANNQY